MMVRKSLVLALASLAIFGGSTPVEAFPGGRYSNNNNYYYYNNYSYNNYYYSTAAPAVPAKISDSQINLRPLDVYFDYDRGKGPEVAFADQIRVFLFVRDASVLEAESVVAEVQLTNLADSQTTHTLYVPVEIDRDAEGEFKVGVIDVTNAQVAGEEQEQPLVEPNDVYRLFVNLHEEADEYSEETALGRISWPYYVATAGDDRLDAARQQIVMRTFKEFYYVQNGWVSEERYVMDCYAYYMWATGFCTTGAQNGHTILGYLFNNQTPFTYGGNIPGIAQEEPIHGDYVRMPGHTFMLLEYDAQQGYVWTMEGNFNSTIEVARRAVGSGWSVGHLAEHHIQGGMFESIARMNEESEEMMMGAEE